MITRPHSIAHICTLLALVSSAAFLGACSSDSNTSSSGDGDGDAGDGDDGQMTDSGSGGQSDGSGGTTDTGGAPSSGATDSGGTSATGGAATNDDPCSDTSLTWKTARKTNYTSYPDPNSEECTAYNGCMWAGWFAGCSDQQPESWVEANNIAAFFPGFDSYDGHQLCIRSGEQVMIVNVVDTCADSDCSGCCTKNQGANDALIDLESYTNARWGLADSVIEWADLGPNPTPICN